MELNTFAWSSRHGWSTSLPELAFSDPLLLVFGGDADVVRPALGELVSKYPGATLCGCSSAGEILGGTISDDTLSVATLQFEHSRHKAVWRDISTASDSESVGRALGAQLQGPDLRGILVLSDGMHVNGSALVNGLRASVASDVVITGGLAGDGSRFEKTWVLRTGVPSSPVVCAVGLYGERLALGCSSGGGWDVFGPERAITRSRDNVLYELDGRPALELYKTYLGGRAAELPASALLFPLSIRPEGSDHSVVRTILAVDESANTMTFAGDVPQGYRAQLMRANFERLIAGSEEAASVLRDSSRFGAKTLALAISCVGRRLVLGERAEEEVEASLAELPTGTQQIGFYSYGEISPSGVKGCDLHNQTMTLTTISEL
jgi:hypothetical protein